MAAESLPQAYSESSEGYVYLIQFGPHYKIGWAKDPFKRIKEFANVVMPHNFKLLWCVYSENARETEAELHRSFAPDRIQGEWFELNYLQVECFCRIPTGTPYQTFLPRENTNPCDAADALDFVQESAGMLFDVPIVEDIVGN